MYLKTLGARLQYIRKQAGLSREYIEKVHNVPAVTVRSWELLGPDIGIYKLIKYLEIYKGYGINFSIDALLDDSRGFLLTDGTATTDENRFLSSSLCLYLLQNTTRIFFYSNQHKEILYLSDHCHSVLASHHKESAHSNYTIQNIIPEEEYHKFSSSIAHVLGGKRTTVSYIANKNNINIQVDLALAPNFDQYGDVIGFAATQLTDFHLSL